MIAIYNTINSRPYTRNQKIVYMDITNYILFLKWNKNYDLVIKTIM